MEERRQEERPTLPLHVSKVQQPRAVINRIHSLIHLIAILPLLYYRASRLFDAGIPILPWALIFTSELLFSFFWLLAQAFRWRPVSRTVFPKRLPQDGALPGIDVFICTADPKKEPTVEVMNTVLSAMSLDYPSEKLSVYLSDDAGSPITLYAIKEAHHFAMSWLPFCRKYGVETRCPEAYFSASTATSGHGNQGEEFMADREKIKIWYEQFKERVERVRESGVVGDKNIGLKKDRPPLVQVINDNVMVASGVNRAKLPLLVYVSREKRPAHPHHFKAGALNVLLRVSGIISNAPHILVLDCDMYCNDPTSARQAMCFHIDPKISQSLAFVQFPQTFHNVTKNDIYDGRLRWVFKIMWPGLDGLKGPMLSGTCFYIKREALYGSTSMREATDALQLRPSFGPSNEFLASLLRGCIYTCNNGIASNALLEEALVLASCAYEKGTKWGEQIGFLYHSVLEDLFTGFHMHCKGWSSIYVNPSRPSFLGNAPSNLNDTLVQNKRWGSGLLQVSFSRFFPLTYGSLRMSVLQSMCYGYISLLPLYAFPVICYAIVPQLCLLNGISLYPKVSNPWFLVFAFVYLFSLYQHLFEVLSNGGSFGLWWNEQRMWMMRSVTSYLFGCLSVMMKLIGVGEVDFDLTNKDADKEQVEIYEMGKFDFQVSTPLLVSLVSLVILNIASFIKGVLRLIFERSYDEMFGQVFISFFIIIISYPIIEAMIMRKDKGCVPTSITFLSLIFSIFFVCLGFMFCSLPI